MWNVRFFAKMILSLTLLAAGIAAGDEKKSIEELWLKSLHAFQSQDADGGRNYYNQFLVKVKDSRLISSDVQVQLMVGVLGCEIPERRDLAKMALERVRERGKDPKQRELAGKYLQRCDTPENVTGASEAMLVSTIVSTSGGGPGVNGTSGKGGFIASQPVPVVVMNHIDAATLEKRLAETDDPPKALAAAEKRFGQGAQGAVTEHFLVVSDQGKQEAQGIADCLDHYRTDLIREFKMQPPEHLVTVYSTNSQNKVYQEAGALHGIHLETGTIAYSVYGDLSMVGVGHRQMCGTLAHELTHLMIKGNFGDAPPWLEEGLASAVALATAEENALEFHEGWRDEVLRDEWSGRPHVAELLHLTWSDFSSKDRGLMRAAAVQAMASIFVRYLAEKKKLELVYGAVRDQDLEADVRKFRSPSQIVEEQMGKSLAEVDRDFQDWFRKEAVQPPQPQGYANEAAPRPCVGELNSPAQQAAPCQPAKK